MVEVSDKINVRKSKEKHGIYPGSFDPLTIGHLDIIRSASMMLDRLTIAIGVHHEKKAMYNIRERKIRLEKAIAKLGGLDCVVDITTFDNLLVDKALGINANFIIRGVRNSTDLDYEMQLSGMNSELAEDIVTILIPSKPANSHISSSLVRQIINMGGDVSKFIP